MIILAIETSCDDTCIATIKALGRKRVRFKILSNIVSSQIKIHRKYGGVYPTLAKREHQRNLVPVLEQALTESLLKGAKLLRESKDSKSQNLKLKLEISKKILKREEILYKQLEKFLVKYQKPEIDVIAVTVGPGLEPCLWVGVNFAKALAFSWKLPIIPINHIEAHIFANWLPPVGSTFNSRLSTFKNIFPAICLVVSGGHTQLILMKNFEEYKIIGETRDDAAGECFDKTARILGMGYPGGPEIERQAAKLKTINYKLKTRLPRPMIHQKNFDFSFSGLKTAVLYNFKKQSPKIRTSKNYIQEMSAEVQQAIIDVLIKKTIKAAKKYKAKTIILGGGVVANSELRKQLKGRIKEDSSNIQYLEPSIQFCTDNAVMVAIAGYFHWLRSEKENWEQIKAEANLRIA
ncbi:tRNA (adenosine(37)-N6)-threonylcarbamoyltransferase complex transferase subunit TsaD [Patescibacteria group bacterium]|nr:tRNA (adenosine(37)-N6)-threonylcarbamoyltransferase complex transferase subunit TsaD [Patescibacteria group bacterium]